MREVIIIKREEKGRRGKESATACGFGEPSPALRGRDGYSLSSSNRRGPLLSSSREALLPGGGRKGKRGRKKKASGKDFFVLQRIEGKSLSSLEIPLQGGKAQRGGAELDLRGRKIFSFRGQYTYYSKRCRVRVGKRNNSLRDA